MSTLDKVKDVIMDKLGVEDNKINMEASFVIPALLIRISIR